MPKIGPPTRSQQKAKSRAKKTQAKAQVKAQVQVKAVGQRDTDSDSGESVYYDATDEGTKEDAVPKEGHEEGQKNAQSNDYQRYRNPELARVIVEQFDNVKGNILREIREDFEDELKDEIKEELKEELKKEIMQEIPRELFVVEAMKYELKELVLLELKDDDNIKDHIADRIRADLEGQLIAKVRGTLEKELRDDCLGQSDGTGATIVSPAELGARQLYDQLRGQLDGTQARNVQDPAAPQQHQASQTQTPTQAPPQTATPNPLIQNPLNPMDQQTPVLIPQGPALTPPQQQQYLQQQQQYLQQNQQHLLRHQQLHMQQYQQLQQYHQHLQQRLQQRAGTPPSTSTSTDERDHEAARTFHAAAAAALGVHGLRVSALDEGRRAWHHAAVAHGVSEAIRGLEARGGGNSSGNGSGGVEGDAPADSGEVTPKADKGKEKEAVAGPDTASAAGLDPVPSPAPVLAPAVPVAVPASPSADGAGGDGGGGGGGGGGKNKGKRRGKKGRSSKHH